MSRHFTGMVEQAFSFLEDAGFRRTRCAPGVVRYESDRSFITIRWDARSGELDALLGIVPRSGHSSGEYSLADVLGVAGLPPSDCRPAQVADEARLESSIATLASNVRKFAHLALSGDLMYYRRLDAFRGAKADAYMREMELRRVRTQVEKAWRDHEFDKVVNLYTSIERDLTGAEMRKLEYAKQHRHA